MTKIFLAHYEPRLRGDNERRVAAEHRCVAGRSRLRGKGHELG